MNLTKAVYQNSLYFFLFFVVGTLLGFWPGYLSEILLETDYKVHIHGLLMSLWLAMLVSQAYLIRTNQRALHRQIGKLSYVLAPIVVISMVLIVHNGESQALEVTDRRLVMTVFTLGFAPLFALIYGLAILYRKNPATHARYMLCTVLPSSGPIFNRVLGNYVAPYVDIVPTLAADGRPFPIIVTQPAVCILLAGLSIWDWKVHRRLNVFPVVLAAFIGLQGLALMLHETEQWRAFYQWFVGLPLS